MSLSEWHLVLMRYKLPKNFSLRSQFDERNTNLSLCFYYFFDFFSKNMSNLEKLEVLFSTIFLLHVTWALGQDYPDYYYEDSNISAGTNLIEDKKKY